MGAFYSPTTGLTILRDLSSPKGSGAAPDPQALALSALGWVLADEDRAGRLLALTGLTPEALRDGLGDPAVLGAVLEFLCGHEADLVAAAHDLGVAPQALAEAGRALA